MAQDTTDRDGVSSGVPSHATSHPHSSVPANALIHLSHGSAPGLGTNALGTNALGADKQIEPLIARMEADLEAARKQGMLGVMRLRYEAWLEERMRGPGIQKMQTRQAVLAEQCKTAEAEIRLPATVQSGEVGAQRHRIEWNDVNRHRLAGELQSLGMITLPTGGAPGLPGEVQLVPPHDSESERVTMLWAGGAVEQEEG